MEKEKKICPYCFIEQDTREEEVSFKESDVLKIKSEAKEEKFTLPIEEKQILQKASAEELEEYEYLAYHDKLTDLKNRQAFEKDKEKFSQRTLTIISLDVNGLKETNDSLGHSYGDHLLKNVAHALVSVYGKENVYRIGGDEFVVALQGIGKKALASLKEQLTLALQERREGLAEDFRITVAYGAASGDGTKSIKEIFDEADRLMYVEKRHQKESEILAEENVPNFSTQEDFYQELLEEEYVNKKRSFQKYTINCLIKIAIFILIIIGLKNI